jgi:hypothetical protein
MTINDKIDERIDSGELQNTKFSQAINQKGERTGLEKVIPICWNKPDKDGNVDIPDYLDKLFNKLGMQMRFHTISGIPEAQAVVNMTWIAEKFFTEYFSGKLIFANQNIDYLTAELSKQANEAIYWKTQYDELKSQLITNQTLKP